MDVVLKYRSSEFITERTVRAQRLISKIRNSVFALLQKPKSIHDGMAYMSGGLRCNVDDCVSLLQSKELMDCLRHCEELLKEERKEESFKHRKDSTYIKTRSSNSTTKASQISYFSSDDEEQEEEEEEEEEGSVPPSGKPRNLIQGGAGPPSSSDSEEGSTEGGDDKGKGEKEKVGKIIFFRKSISNERFFISRSQTPARRRTVLRGPSARRLKRWEREYSFALIFRLTSYKQMHNLIQAGKVFLTSISLSFAGQRQRHGCVRPRPPRGLRARQEEARKRPQVVAEAMEGLLEDEDGVSVLVIGRSGSGKTRLIRRLCESDERPVLLINGDPSDYRAVDHYATDALTESVTKVHNSTIIIEDHFSLTPKEHATFRKLLSFTKRHKNVHVLVASHSVAHTSLRALLPHFDYVVFTKTRQDDENVRNFINAVKPSGLTGEDFERVPQKGYGVWCNKKNRFSVARSDFSFVQESKGCQELEEKKERAIREITAILQIYPDYLPNSVCFLHYLIRNIDLKNFNFSDYTITAATGDYRRTNRICLPDYILACMRSERPSEKMLSMKRHFAKLFYTPDALVPNKHMRTDA